MWLGPPVQCWIEVMRAGIFVLFLTLGRKHPVFHNYVIRCEVSVTALYRVAEIAFYTWIVEYIFEFKVCFLWQHVIGALFIFNLGWQSLPLDWIACSHNVIIEMVRFMHSTLLFVCVCLSFCISLLPLQRIEQIFSNVAFGLECVLNCFGRVWFFANPKN